jgi:predicted CxxxxCH...CXXCH cytochrome family protein
VGAHQRHLVGGSVRGPLACSECHVVPTDFAHANQPLDLTWGSLARTGGTVPSWSAMNATCTNYCHGASITGGSLAAPVWTKVDGTQAACGTCHGLPPASPHPIVTGGLTACAGCHAGTVNADGTINVAGGLHVDGSVQLAGGSGSCTGCHGDATRTPASIAAAPPKDTSGNTATTSPGVGAHQAHLVGGSIRSALQCTDCHAVPADLAHASQPLDLTWGPLARTGGITPAWNATLRTCANYCHGATLASGSLTAPVWNTVNGTQAACGTCHGLPPASPHPSVSGGLTSCSGCHAGTVNPDGTIKLTGGLHVNGVVEVAGTGGCTGCHGDPARTPAAIAPAPPLDTHGNSTTTAGGVGAHQRHLTGGLVRGPVPCTECHTVPGDLTHATQPLVLTWGPLATALGASASFNPTSLTCANYCHGATMRGGSITAPLWNKVDNTQAACGTCHGLPPSSPHPTVSGGLTVCAGCHPGTVNPDGSINVAGGLHIDGAIQATGGHADFTSPAVHGPQFFDFMGSVPGALNCTNCHGTTYGGGTGPSCNACHATNGWTASWQTNCSFCHGTKNAFTQGTAYAVGAYPLLSAPPDAIAQRLDPSHAAVPNRTGAHVAHLTGRGSTSSAVYSTPLACGNCHVVPTKLSHIGGSTSRATVTLVGTGSLPANLGTYSQSTGTCTTYCHSPASPPAWTGGERGCAGCHGYPPTSGQHDLHVNQMGWWCADCHFGTVDYANNIIGTGHLNGVPDVVFYSPGSTWNAASCTSTCHDGSGWRSW